jgi:hypothetical protein
MVLPPLRLNGVVLTRFVKSFSSKPPETPVRLTSVASEGHDFDALLREETRQRAARLCHYSHHRRSDPVKGGKG